jgi:RNA polymerase sigma factor (TIGR02999 family)
MDDSSDNTEEIDGLIEAIRGGDRGAMDRLVSLVDGELRRRAHSMLRFAPRDQTLRTDALVHEAYLGMVSKPPRDWKDRAFFFRVASRKMRSILVDYYRERSALKRGGGSVVRGFEPDNIVKAGGAWRIGGTVMSKEDWLFDLDEALGRLERVNETWADIVDMHFFQGMTLEKIAEVLNTTRDAVRGQWRLAKAWLRREMEGDEDRRPTEAGRNL